MQVYPHHYAGDLTPGLQRALTFFRDQRNFDAQSYVDAKAGLLNDYMRRSGLKSCVVAVSGGLDSAAVLALVKQASLQENSPIQRIIPVCLPVRTPGATTNQDAATNKGEAVAQAMGLQPFTIDLSESHQAIKRAVDAALGIQGNHWASGQLAATTRTPANYYVTSLMSQIGLPAILVGTTNRDEGAYLGYVGKASDAMVDVQLISDLHKSEVYKVAAHLNVPESVLKAAPTGDMYDGRTDADVFGASYDAAELYLSMLCANEPVRQSLMQSWDPADRDSYAVLATNLEELHRYNAHKYISEWQGVHLNILPTAVPGGWQYGPTEPKFAKHEAIDKLSGLFDVPKPLSDWMAQQVNGSLSRRSVPYVCKVVEPRQSALELEHLLLPEEVSKLTQLLARQPWFPVGVSGFENEYRPGDPIGSWRLRTYSQELADILWQRIRTQVEPLSHIPENGSQDAKDAVVWRAVGINPLFRLIKYESEGSLAAHYDAPAELGNGCKTLKSVVIYLTDSTAADGGVTRFIRDPQEAIPVMQRDYRDWPRCANPDEVVTGIVPKAGNALVFDHRILHDSSPFDPSGTGPKIIIRTDVVYQAMPTPRTVPTIPHFRK